jgi:hypothetical protein
MSLTIRNFYTIINTIQIKNHKNSDGDSKSLSRKAKRVREGESLTQVADSENHS